MVIPVIQIIFCSCVSVYDVAWSIVESNVERAFNVCWVDLS